jgi:hypothetical protein
LNRHESAGISGRRRPYIILTQNNHGNDDQLQPVL